MVAQFLQPVCPSAGGGRAQWPGNQPPRTIGSSASALLKMVDGSHYEVKATAQEWRTLWLWIESGAPYAGTYAALRNEKAQEIAGFGHKPCFPRAGSGAAAPLFLAAITLASSVGKRCRLPFDYEARRKSKGGLQRPTAVYERIVLEDDPMARFSVNIMLELHAPAVVSVAAGAFGQIGGRLWQLRRGLQRHQRSRLSAPALVDCERQSRPGRRTAFWHARLQT